jgi:predicted RNA binding protein YcfA (HicA-like mRNA interferase family)
MPPRLRRLSAKEVLRALHHFGFETVKTRGSDAKLRRLNHDGRVEILTIPLHKSLAPGTLRAIYRQSLRYLSEDELRPFFFSDSD